MMCRRFVLIGSENRKMIIFPSCTGTTSEEVLDLDTSEEIGRKGHGQLEML